MNVSGFTSRTVSSPSFSLRDERLELLAERRAARRGREVVDHLEPDVVPGARVLRAGVAEADDDFHGGQWSVVSSQWQRPGADRVFD